MTTHTARTVEDFEAILSDDRQLASMFRNGRPLPAFGEFVQGYVNAITADGSIGDQVRDEVNAAVSSLIGDRGVGKRPNLFGGVPQARSGGLAIHNKHAPGAQIDRLFNSSSDTLAADVFRTVWHNGPQSGPMADLREKMRISNLSSNDSALGGFLIPEEMRSGIIQSSLETAIIRPRATVIPMSTLRMTVPVADETTHVGSVFGGLVGYWTEEGAQLTASDPTFGRVLLDVKKLTIRSDVPNELMADSPALQAFLGSALPETAAFFEDLAFMFGSGAGEPFGIFNPDNSGRVLVAKEGGQAAATIVWANILKMYSRMLPTSLNRAVWVASPDTFPQLATMNVTVGTGGSAVWGADGAAAAPSTILGRPLVFSEKMKALGTEGDIAFIDPAYYLIGDRQTMAIESSIHARFTQDMTVFKLVERVDGRPAVQSPITPAGGGSTLSPYVLLQTR